MVTAANWKLNVKLTWLCNCEPVFSCVHQRDKDIVRETNTLLPLKTLVCCILVPLDNLPVLKKRLVLHCYILQKPSMECTDAA